MSASRSLQPLLRRGPAAAGCVRGAARQHPLMSPVSHGRRCLHDNASAPVLYSAHARVLGARKGHVEGENLHVDLTMAKALGGPGDRGKTNPEELFAAGYGACFQSAMNACAAQMGIQMPSDVQDSVVDSTVHLVGDMKSLDMGSRATKGNVTTNYEVVDFEGGSGSGSGSGGGHNKATGSNKPSGSGGQKPTDNLQDEGGYQ
jgi:organic hydroperoxide reductase OsmC/OhrA